jgi:hypothetical protein
MTKDEIVDKVSEEIRLYKSLTIPLDKIIPVNNIALPKDNLKEDEIKIFLNSVLEHVALNLHIPYEELIKKYK